MVINGLKQVYLINNCSKNVSMIILGCLDETTLDKLEYLPLLQVFKDVGLRIPMFSPVRPRLWDRSEPSTVTQIIE